MREARRIGAGLAVAALALGCPAAQAGDATKTASRLRDLVVQDCGSCHGLKLTGGLGKSLTPDAIAHLPPEALTEIILQGIPGTPMPPWQGLLSRAEAQAIADMLSEGRVP
jgi:cytochrome c55X